MEEKFREFDFNIQKWRRYYNKLYKYYDGCHNITRAVEALSGTSAFVAAVALAPIWITGMLTGLVGVAATLDLVFRPDKKIPLLAKLYREFTLLGAELHDCDKTDENLKLFKRKRDILLAEDLSEKKLVEISAHNDEMRARGYPESDFLPLKPYQRWLGYVAPIGLRQIENELRTKKLDSSNNLAE